MLQHFLKIKSNRITLKASKNMKKKWTRLPYRGLYLAKVNLTMKITCILLLIATFQLNASIYSQSTLLTLNMESQSVGQVFDRIEKLSGFNFLYNNSYINLDRKVSVIVDNERVDKVLYRIFKNTDVDFIILDKQIILKRKHKKSHTSKVKRSNVKREALPEKQQVEIKGVVTDNNGMPIPGVNVLVKDTQRGVSTDFDGNYTIEATEGEILVFTYLGYLTVEVLIEKGKTQYNVELTSTSIELDDIEIVSTGYQDIPKIRATGSFANIGEKLMDKKAVVDPLNYLKGEVTGVLFNANNEDNPITIRGVSTIRSNRNPLLVVDGFPILEGSLKTINPNDIKSISVLKDAAAASIWGIRATNGVIVVVTKKRGENTEPRIDFSVNTFLSPKPNLKKNNLASPSTQIDYALEYINNGLSFIDPTYAPGDSELSLFNINQAPSLNTILHQLERGEITQQQADSRINALRRTDVRDEYSRLILRPKLRTQYNLGISGGGEKHGYRMSLLYNREDGHFINEKSDQIVANIKNSIDFNSKLKLRTNFNASFNKEHLNPEDPGDDSAVNGFLGTRSIYPSSFILNYPLSTRILDDNGNYVAMQGGAGRAASDFFVEKGLLPFTYNIKEEFENNNNTLNSLDLRLQTVLSYDIIDGLTIEGRYQYESTRGQGENILNENRYWNRATYGFYAQTTDADDLDNYEVLSTPISRGSMARFTNIKTTGHTFRTQLNFEKSFDGLHEVNAIAGYEARKIVTEGNGSMRYGYDEQSLSYINPNYNEQYTFKLFYDQLYTVEDHSKVTFNENRFLSYFTNLGYTYDNKYTLTASARLDDSNLFGQSDDYKNIPLYSIGAKWKIDNENFFNSRVIDDLSFRFTYGTNGNVNFETSPFLQLGITNSVSSNYLNTNFAYINTVPNSELRLEKTRTFNYGLDIGLLQGGLSASIEYYQKNSEDLLVEQLLNSTSGVTQALLNVGELKNEGIDIGLTANFFQNKAFNYSSRLNFSYNNNKITKLENDPITDTSELVSGSGLLLNKPLDYVYSFNYAGLDSQGNPQFFDENKNIVDYNTEMTVDALIEGGTTVAPYYGSWMNNLSYKNWSLRTLASFQAGHVFRYEDVFNPGSSNEYTTYKDYEQRWQKPGDENWTDVPSLARNYEEQDAVAYFADGPYLSSDKFLDSASTITLQEVILNYSFNKKVLEQFGMDSFTLSFQGNNLKVWNFNKWDVDPNNTLIPLIPTYNFAIRTSF